MADSQRERRRSRMMDYNIGDRIRMGSYTGEITVCQGPIDSGENRYIVMWDDRAPDSSVRERNIEPA